MIARLTRRFLLSCRDGKGGFRRGDHWPHANSVVLAGGGIRGGQVYGATDKNAAFPTADPVTPGDVTATIFHALGMDPHTEIHDQLQRPHRLADGTPIAKLIE